MNTSSSGVIAIELRPLCASEWIVSYYPVLDTASGRLAEIDLVLHQHRLPAHEELDGPAVWAEARSADPSDPCYARFPVWRAQLAAGYEQALACYDTKTVDGTSSIQDPELLRAATTLADPAQLPPRGAGGDPDGPVENARSRRARFPRCRPARWPFSSPGHRAGGHHGPSGTTSHHPL